MRSFVLVFFYICVALLPLGLAWFSGIPFRSFWDELASGAGMLAYSIILLEFVLSGRFQAISGSIGMDVTMRLHQLLARAALVLALIHPFLYRSPFNTPYPWDVTRQLTLTFDIESLGTGILAWLLLPAFVVLGIARSKLDFSYETWRLMHGVGALLIAALILQHALSSGRYSQAPLLSSLWVILFITALISLIYVYVIGPFMQRRKPWAVHSVQPIGLKTWELTLEPEQHEGIRYTAGQFVWLNIGNSPFSLHENPFSISSAPASGSQLQFVIKELGDFTRTIGSIKLGTRAYIDGPHGNLVISDRTEPGIAMIAGGVGIAPLLGILRQLHLEDDKRPTLMLYGNRVEEQIIYREELETFAEQHDTEVALTLSEPPEDWAGCRGRIDAGIIRQFFQSREMKDWLFVLCGPSAMMEKIKSTLIEMGVPEKRILSEKFTYD